MDLVNRSKYKIILGSGSARRSELLSMTGINFIVNSIPVDESFPDSLEGAEISEYIVKNKSDAFNDLIKKNEIIITADTLVWFENQCLGKPKDKKEAKYMLKLFAGKSHDVITSVGFLTSSKFKLLTESTTVRYKNLSDKEIEYYVEKENPIDKAGSYGIQDWIGMVGVENVNGSYTSVLGLPVPQVTNEIINIINENL